jgi:hypothetical protein
MSNLTVKKADSKPVGTADYAWNWVAVQLDEPKMEISAATLIDPRTLRVMEIKAVVVAADGSRSQFDGYVNTHADFNTWIYFGSAQVEMF